MNLHPLATLTSWMVVLFISSVGALSAADQRDASDQPTAEQTILQQAAADSESVVTPMGPRPRSQVHRLERGQVLNFQGDHIDVIDQAGVVRARHQLEPSRVIPATNGYVTDTAWYNSSGHPITSFSSVWTVPPPPVAWDGQTIFLFNGIENTDHILQPVLQYGYSYAGGGPFWSIASWYADGYGNAFVTALTPVAPGTTLTGIIARTGSFASAFNYVCYFAGVADSVLPIYNIAELKYCLEALEVYNVVQGNDYPATNGIVFGNIQLVTTAGYAYGLNWTTNDFVRDRGQHSYVISNSPVGGAIALFFY